MRLTRGDLLFLATLAALLLAGIAIDGCRESRKDLRGDAPSSEGWGDEAFTERAPTPRVHLHP